MAQAFFDRRHGFRRFFLRGFDFEIANAFLDFRFAPLFALEFDEPQLLDSVSSVYFKPHRLVFGIEFGVFQIELAAGLLFGDYFRTQHNDFRFHRDGQTVPNHRRRRNHSHRFGDNCRDEFPAVERLRQSRFEPFG